jgi:electron transport complex protein RnfD
MSFFRASSPHTHNPSTTQRVMRDVLLATVPGVAVLTYFFGLGTLSNIVVAGFFALLLEALILWLRQRPVVFYLKDLSALVTAVLLAVAMPPGSSWWLIAVGMIASIIFAKQLYGGLGHNPFNPAMVGYVVLLIAYPQFMTQWVAPTTMTMSSTLFEPATLINLVTGHSGLDGLTAATPLDVFKQSTGLTTADIYAAQTTFQKGMFAGAGYEWVNVAFLFGGIYLLLRKVFTWHAPVAMLTVLFILSAFFNDGGSSNSSGSPILHLFSGATMLGAFFIVTDPVSSATSQRGRLVYGALIGLLVFIIRVLGNYPDGVAFAVLLMNFAAPFIDYYTPPRAYGHKRAKNTVGSGGGQ